MTDKKKIDSIKQDSRKGYKGETLAVLQKYDVDVWSDAKIGTTGGNFRGIILPRAENTDENHLVIKLNIGYNIGITTSNITKIEKLGFRKANYKIPEQEFPFDPVKPNVQLLGTGGTIASRLDYRTGAVIPAFSPGELYGAVPELADICNLKTEKLFGVFSENMGPNEYIGLAKAAAKYIDEGADGIVVGHGTDTLHHTAAAMSYMLQDLPVPFVLVGSQRSSDRPSSDAAINLMNATYTAGHGDIAEVMVCMFGPTSDEYDLLHQGTRVRKMHSSYRSTFRTLSDRPLAMVNWEEGITPIRTDYRRRGESKKVKLDAVFDDRVAILYYYPAMKPDMIDSLIENGYKGIVIAGTGLGHVNKPLYPALRRAKEAGVFVIMTVQTLFGFVQMYVYDTGRDMMALGVVPGENLTPEAAYIKLGWVLGHEHPENLEERHTSIKKMMLTPVARDITFREPVDGYMIYQGGTPEVEEFLKKYHH